MNPNVNELYAYLSANIPSSLSCDWDNDGLMTAVKGGSTVNKVLLSLDVSKKVIEKAKELGCDAVISHHPLIFKPMRSVTEADPTAEIVIFSIVEGVAVMSFHTRLDALDGGVNDVLANVIDVKNTKNFGPAGEEIGRIGTLDTETSAKDLALRVKNALGADAVRLTDSGRNVRTVAVLGGGGKDYVIPAYLAGADVLVTGEIGYNTAVIAADLGISVIEAGHYFTEALVLPMLESLILREFPGITVEYENSNPSVTL